MAIRTITQLLNTGAWASGAASDKVAVRAGDLSITRPGSRGENSDVMPNGLPQRSFWTNGTGEFSCTTPAFLFDSDTVATKKVYYRHLIQACGLTYADSSGTHTFTRQLTEANQKQAWLALYQGNTELALKACRGNMQIASTGTGMPLQFSFNYTGRLDSEAYQGTAPTLATNTAQPVYAMNMTVTIKTAPEPGGTQTTRSFVVRSFTFDLGAQITSTSDLTNDDGLGDPIISMFKPTLALEIEKPTITSGDDTIASILRSNDVIEVSLRAFESGDTTQDYLDIKLDACELAEANGATDGDGILVEALTLRAVDDGVTANDVTIVMENVDDA